MSFLLSQKAELIMKAIFPNRRRMFKNDNQKRMKISAASTII